MPHDRVCPACKKRFGLDGRRGLCPESHFDKGERAKCPDCGGNGVIPLVSYIYNPEISPPDNPHYEQCPTCKGTGRRNDG